jgi:hypothetical protein
VANPLNRMVSSSQVSDWFGQKNGVSSIPSRGNTDIPNTGLQLYLDASNPISYSGSGTTWSDLSGKNRNFTWTSSPSYNSSGIKYFNTNGYGANGPASNSFEINNTSGYTIFFTMYQNATAQTGAFKWYSTNTGSTVANRGIFSHATWVDGNLYWDQGGCCGVDVRTFGAVTNSTGNWHVLGLRCNYSQNNRTIWDNGNVIVTNINGIANLNLSGTAANIGYTDEYGSTWNARIGQFAVYNRSLSDIEMNIVTNTFKSKVGL